MGRNDHTYVRMPHGDGTTLNDDLLFVRVLQGEAMAYFGEQVILVILGAVASVQVVRTQGFDVYADGDEGRRAEKWFIR